MDPEAQRAFDAVFQRARRHASAAGNQGALDPFDAILLVVLIENEMEIQRLLARVSWLENEMPYLQSLKRDLGTQDAEYGPAGDQSVEVEE